MEMNNYRISGNLVTNLIIIYHLILRCPDQLYTSLIGFTQILILIYPG